MNAYYEGIKAYQDGLDLDYDNPYETGTEDFDEWENGWLDAEDEQEALARILGVAL